MHDISCSYQVSELWPMGLLFSCIAVSVLRFTTLTGKIYILDYNIVYFVAFLLKRLALVAQLDARLTGDQELQIHPPPDRQHSFVEI